MSCAKWMSVLCLFGVLSATGAVGCATGPLEDGSSAQSYDSGWLPVEASPQRGAETGFVTIVVFNDLASGGGDDVAQLIEQIRGQKESVRVVYKHFPIDEETSREVAMALEAAKAQGAFWAMHDALVDHGSDLDGDETQTQLADLAEGAGLDREAFGEALASAGGEFEARIERDVKLANKLGLEVAPVAFVNGERLAGKNELGKLAAVVDRRHREASILVRGGVSPSMVYQTAAMLNRGTTGSAGGNDGPGSVKFGSNQGTGAAQVEFVEKGDETAETEGELKIGRGPDPESDAEVPIGNSPVRGARDAKVTVVVFSDFECPFCEKGYSRLEKLGGNYSEEIRIVFKHYPLPFHKSAKPAARAAMAAREQGEAYFWKMHDRLFENQKKWKNEDLLTVTAKWAGQMGMDVDQFKRDFKGNKDAYNRRIQADMDLGKSLGVKGTPHFLINGEELSGAQPYNKFKRVVEDKLDQADKLLEGGVSRSDLYAKAVARNFGGEGAEEAREEVEEKQNNTKVSYVPVEDDDPTRGASEEEAVVTIVEFSDFQCPFCNKAKPTIKKVRENYPDKVRFVYKHRPLGFHENAKPAARAAIAAHQQGKFWEMYDLLFANQKRLGGEGIFEEFAGQIGLDVEKFKEAMRSDETERILQNDIDLANEIGAKGTPNFWINGVNVVGAQPYSKFELVVEEQIEKAEKLKDETGLSGEKLYKAVAEANEEDVGSGESAENDNPEKKKDAPEVDTDKLAISDAPAKGPDDAPITLYMFSEFQCPYCKKAKPTIEKVEEEYGDEIKFVFKHYPLPFHNDARPAAKAAVAAQKQGKFWEMHDVMFENQKQLGEEGIFAEWAEEIGLNVDQFEKDRDAVPDSRIDDDMEMGKSVGVKGTPAFFINGKWLVGAQPFSKFEAIIEEELE